MWFLTYTHTHTQFFWFLGYSIRKVEVYNSSKQIALITKLQSLTWKHWIEKVKELIFKSHRQDTFILVQTFKAGSDLKKKSSSYMF